MTLNDRQPRRRLGAFLLRLAVGLNTVWLVFSALLFTGLFAGGAFVADFTVVNQTGENGTGETIRITPVGTVGKLGDRSPLPIYRWTLPQIPAVMRGGFTLSPGDAITLMYDMDDINFSEIVVETATGPPRQLIVDPRPTEHQYHRPSRDQFVIDDLAALDPVPPPVLAAARRAQKSMSGRLWFELGFIVFPWLMAIPLNWFGKRSKRSRPCTND